MRRQCERDCSESYSPSVLRAQGRGPRDCATELFDLASTSQMATTARRVLATPVLPGVNVEFVDAHSITRDRCTFTGANDGRHYHNLDGLIALRFVAALPSTSAVARERAHETIARILLKVPISLSNAPRATSAHSPGG